MGLDDIVGDGLSIQEKRDITVLDLENMYGKEAARRGIEYMKSLSEADNNYRQAAQDNNYGEEMKERVGDKDLSSEAQRASSKWVSNMENRGLALSEPDDGE